MLKENFISNNCSSETFVDNFLQSQKTQANRQDENFSYLKKISADNVLKFQTSLDSDFIQLTREYVSVGPFSFRETAEIYENIQRFNNEIDECKQRVAVRCLVCVENFSIHKKWQYLVVFDILNRSFPARISSRNYYASKKADKTTTRNNENYFLRPVKFFQDLDKNPDAVRRLSSILRAKIKLNINFNFKHFVVSPQESCDFHSLSFNSKIYDENAKQSLFQKISPQVIRDLLLQNE